MKLNVLNNLQDLNLYKFTKKTLIMNDYGSLKPIKERTVDKGTIRRH